MENFNTKEYRDNLAKDLKDIRKDNPEQAQEMLAEAQGTEEYQEAKRIHQENREQKEKLGELAYVPIFRGNALYNAMFPDVEPLFQAGEEPDAKIILQEILKHTGKKIVMDGTTQNELQKLTAEDIKMILPDVEIKQYQNGNLDVMGSLQPAFEKYNIVLSGNLDSRVSKKENENFFSPEDAKEIVSLIKNQVPDVNRVIIAVDRMGSHVLSGRKTKDENLKEMWETLVNTDVIKTRLNQLDSILEDSKTIKFLRSNPEVNISIESEKEADIIPTSFIADEVKKELRIDAEFISNSIDLSTIDEKTALVFDRHNNLAHEMKLHEKIPQQTIIMPLSSGIYHAQSIGALKTADEDYAMQLRHLFEKK